MPSRPTGLSWRHKKIGHKVVPHKSGVHRLACLVLYKHLLRQIPSTPLDQSLLGNVLRAEFRRDVGLRQFAEIRQAMSTGYHMLALLETLRKSKIASVSIANNDPKSAQEQEHWQPLSIPQQALNTKSSPLEHPSDWQSISTSIPFSTSASSPGLIPSLNSYLSKLHAQHVACIPPPAPEPPRLWPYPGGNKVLNRPLPLSQLSGRRHIPKLINACGMPMLRITKPQPAFISKIIRTKIETKQRRFDQVIAMQELMDWAVEEDEWDVEMGIALATKQGLAPQSRTHGESSMKRLRIHAGVVSVADAVKDTVEVAEDTYAATLNSVISEIRGKIRMETKRQRDLADKFWGIVKAETRLAEQEKEMKRKERVEKWIARTKEVVEGNGGVWVERTGGKHSRM